GRAVAPGPAPSAAADVRGGAARRGVVVLQRIESDPARGGPREAAGDGEGAAARARGQAAAGGVSEAMSMATAVMTNRDYKSELKPIWCPGCGDFGVVQAVYRALAAVGRPPHEIAFVSGIGCSSRIPGYTTAYGFNTVHGRALPIAQGIKLA